MTSLRVDIGFQSDDEAITGKCFISQFDEMREDVKASVNINGMHDTGPC